MSGKTINTNIQNENIPDENGTISFRIELENTSCFYFCDHFYKNFKDKVRIRGASVIRENRTKEVIGYCADCEKYLSKLLKCDKLTKYFFFEMRKFLIQCYPIATSKSKYIMYVNSNVASE